MGDGVIISAISAIVGAVIGAFIQSSVQIFQININEKYKYALFARKMLDFYIPNLKLVMNKLKKMDSSDYIDFDKNRQLGVDLVVLIEEIKKLEIEINESYPLKLRDKLFYIFHIKNQIFIYAKILTDQENIELYRSIDLKQDIEYFLDLSSYHIETIEKIIKKKYS